MRLYRCDKSVLSFKNSPSEFLNGITSNTLEAPRNAFLTIHGKIVATFDQLKISDNEFWIAVESSYADALLAHAGRYAKLAKVDIQKLGLHVYFDLDADAPLFESERTIPQKQGRLIISAQPRETNVAPEEFLAFRLEHAIAALGVDYKDDFILNVSEEEFVSYTKGCFLGQEPVSKVHHRSKPTWRLVVKRASDCSEEELKKMTSVFKGGTKDAQGFVFEKND